MDLDSPAECNARSQSLSEGTRAPAVLSGLIWMCAVLKAAPEFPGRNTLFQMLRRYALGFDARVTGELGPGLRFESNPSVDANSLEPLLLRFIDPELGPVLRSALGPGESFVDVGANVGTYSLLGASLVGERGRVLAFEPVPSTRAQLERNLALNRLPQVEIVPRGLGAEPGRAILHVVPGASGLSSRYHDVGGSDVEIEVTTLDRALEGTALPALVKIDVEGMELEVLKGATGLLGSAHPPLVVLEAQSQHLQAAGTSYRELRAFLAEHGGYEIFALGRRGLRPEPAHAVDPSTADVLAARPDVAEHAQAIAALRSVHFRNQEPAWHTRMLARFRQP